ncbi:DUF4158 domain-containing protein [Streptomyces antimycoticus]|uniref:DUF4158 domain-containing protein n=1 Tax=Streptomyces mordarskii TaxID=1226758 RepID=A0ABN1EAM8_9ACTN|nr:DUF4158 domain-containing protein [Streptomyces antimycoticus]
MPVEFLTDEQAAKYAAYDGAPSRTELERFFFLDDADRALIEPKRRAHNRLGFAVQMTTVRFLGVFLDDPTDVPAEAVNYLAEQLGVADRSALKAYGERENTRLGGSWSTRSSPSRRRSCGRGWMRGPGRPGRARRRCSTRRRGGCVSGGCCCPG